MYRDGKLGVVVNVGSPDPTRSHFDAQDYMESGTPGRKSTRDGWLARAVAALNASDRSPFTSVALTSQMPRTLAGERDAIALEDFRKLEVPPRMEELLARVERAYAEDTSPAFRDAGVQAFRALEMFRKSDPFRGESGVRLRRSRRGGRGVLRQLAELLKADLGIRAAFVESGGWDTHFAQGGATGQMANLMGGLASSLVSFFDEVSSKVPVTLLVVTEFGRTARINGAGGTDHGHGAALLALGAGVNGGRVHGDWLGLKTNDLYEGRDLPVTTDFRDVFDEAARHAFALDRAVDLFPGYRPRGVGVIGPAPSSSSASILAASSAKRAR